MHQRRIFLAVATGLIASLTACSSEPDFDERYDTLSEDIEARAEKIENELAKPETPQSEESEEARPTE